MMTSAQVVETSVNVTSNSPSQDYTHPDDHNLPNYDIQFVRFLKTNRPSLTTGELHKHVQQHCIVSRGTSKSATQRVLKNDMGDGKLAWKKLTRPVAEKFTPENLNYWQDFVDYISSVDPYKLMFFDVSGIKLADDGSNNNL